MATPSPYALTLHFLQDFLQTSSSTPHAQLSLLSFFFVLGNSRIQINILEVEKSMKTLEKGEEEQEEDNEEAKDD